MEPHARLLALLGEALGAADERLVPDLCREHAHQGHVLAEARGAAGVSGAQWTIKLPTTCKIGSKAGKKGVWFAIQADFDQVNGQWFWGTQTTADRPNEADWADTQNLFGLGCISFAKPPSGSDVGANRDMQDCIFGGDLGEKDFIMVLS